MEHWEQTHVTYCSGCKKYAYPTPLHPDKWEICSCGRPLEDTGQTTARLAAEKPAKAAKQRQSLQALQATDPANYKTAMAKYQQELQSKASAKIIATMACCHCGSTQIQVAEEGIRLGRAIESILWIGPLGIFGNGRTVYTCQNCGRKWHPGEEEEDSIATDGKNIQKKKL